MSGVEESGQAGVLTASQLGEFADLFLEWLDRHPNRDCLEAGGLGDLPSLAPKVLAWAASVAPPGGR
ncbi:hypothetical protein UFOVP1672_78 [uncultured Caudovirales phage]|uniref:Uncharacterized protein n=1 Tax=uncultured Caudovirales phage TaxID=2100421 RepID=A0A6J5T781_9CAUD|nr:hypothetical protein UFOVP988_16 [uncultured Caudovirales phage]CAB4210500.1 hypothetical protein UFOVP1425_16 [uncultured Caudovirales phage]CAB4223490.1 hypothetical protein UFOVP1672_78 [uncultured Caudovirales phage]